MVYDNFASQAATPHVEMQMLSKATLPIITIQKESCPSLVTCPSIKAVTHLLKSDTLNPKL